MVWVTEKAPLNKPQINKYSYLNIFLQVLIVQFLIAGDDEALEPADSFFQKVGTRYI
jgi:hypothetical protein